MKRNDEFIEKRLGGPDSVWNKLQYDRDGIIEASAGTGKTYALQSIVLKLVADKKDPVDVKNILLVTFTEKAAGELKDRIRDILSEAGLLSSDFDETMICTIHSFCREILSEYAFENRVPMQMEIGGANGDLIHSAVRTALMGDDFKARYGEAYDAYMDAAELFSTDDLVTAVENALGECAKLDQAPPTPQHLDDGMRRGFAEMASSTILDFNGITVNARAKEGFDNACASIAAAKEDLASADFAAFARAVKECAANFKKMNPSVNGRGRGTRLFDVRPELKSFAEALSNVQAVISSQMVADLASFSWPVFKHLKDEAAMLTFDDLVTKAYRVIEDEARRETEGKRSALMDSIRRRYRIALVDEFQDTNERQWTIFRSLFSSRVNRIEGDGASHPKQGFLLVVGDPKQSIYSFQGADVATYLAAKGRITKGEGTQPQQSLDKTFRSCKALVESFKNMFGENSGWFSGMEEGGETIDYPEVGYPDGNERFLDLEDMTGRSAVTLLESLPRQLPDIESNRGAPGYGNMSMCLPIFMRNAAREMKRLCSLPVAYRTRDSKTGELTDRRIRYGDMCVLVRGNAGAKIVKRALAEMGIPYSHYKERGIYGSVEAEALIAFFDFLSAPERSGNLAALLVTPLFNIHPSELEAWLASGDKQLAGLVERWQELSAQRSWIALFESVMNDTALAHPAPNDYEYDRRWTACRQILDRLLAEKGRSALVPNDFAELLRAWRKDDQRAGEDGALRQKENEGDSVQIMTMHASKGLEFKAVFIASGFSKPKDGDSLEEKRLYYVALTRAEHKLYLPWTQWDRHLRVNEEERGLGSSGSPLLGDGFLSRAILTSFAAEGKNAGKETVSLPAETMVDFSEKGDGASKQKGMRTPQVYDIGYLKHLRLQWDSFSSLCRHDATDKVVPSVENETDEMSDGRLPAQTPVATLLPRNNVSGNVFHEIMETLCGTDEAAGGTGFAIGAMPLDEVLADSGPLMSLVRRTMRRNVLGNQESGGDSTERSLARMVWRALNTCIEIGERKIYLKDIKYANRLAEVEFVIDEASVLDANTPRIGDIVRDGAFNGKIDLLIRPDGKDGPVYVLDWKTNTLADYGKASVEAAMAAAGYPLQFKLYSLAVARWLGREALAGVAYLFVRGGEHGDKSGVYARTIDEKALECCRQSVLGAVSSGK